VEVEVEQTLELNRNEWLHHLEGGAVHCVKQSDQYRGVFYLTVPTTLSAAAAAVDPPPHRVSNCSYTVLEEKK
jgi:hypothetical protein